MHQVILSGVMASPQVGELGQPKHFLPVVQYTVERGILRVLYPGTAQANRTVGGIEERGLIQLVFRFLSLEGIYIQPFTGGCVDDAGHIVFPAGDG